MGICGALPRFMEKKMIILKVCIGSSCHIKGARQVVEEFQRLIAENNVGDKVTLEGTFCLNRCQEGVCVTLNDEFASLSPETAAAYFNEKVLPLCKIAQGV